MTETQEGKQGTPKHLWIVGVVSGLWNSFGAMDYVMTQTQNESYMAQFTPEQLEFFYGFPVWATASWAIAVWGAVLGSLLLLFKKRFAVQVFLVALVALLITAFRNFVLANGMEAMGGAVPMIFTIVIFAGAIALFLYARAMEKSGVLQ
jgi:hypothetical protein